MKRNIKQPVGFDGKELQGYFMISNKDAATAILNKLTGSQLRLWLYLMMIDTSADFTSDGETIYHPIPSPDEIGIKLGIASDTVQKDMRQLKKLGLYDYRITEWQGHNSTSNHAKQESLKLKQKKPLQSGEKQNSNNPSPQSKTSQTQSAESEGLNSPRDRLNSPSQPPNRAPQATPDAPQTIQTYSDFINTLSEGEREKFFEFVKNKIKNFPHPINDLEAWLAKPNNIGRNRWEVYYQLFRESQTTTISPKQHRPLRDEIEQRRREMLELWEKEYGGNTQGNGG